MAVATAAVLWLATFCFFCNTIDNVSGQCPMGSGPVCPFSSQCQCANNSQNQWDVYCVTSTVFPTFSLYDDIPISSINVNGTYGTIFDNSFFLLRSLINATVCLQYSTGYTTSAPSLYVSNNTFRTAIADGITSLWFINYVPTITTFTNAQYINRLVFYYTFMSSSQMESSLSNFPTLKYLDLVVNEITTVNTTWFFKLAYLHTLIVQNNYYYSITYVDPGFSDWFSYDPTNVFYFNNNKVQCDSSMQWMAKHALCKPYQLVINGTVCADNNQPFYLYLLSFIDSCP